MSADLVVGFDLDMTLTDPRAGIVATYDALAARTGVPIDSALAASRLGPPLEQELACWFPPEQVPGAADGFRELYAEHAVPRTTTLPGAAEALQAVRARGGRVVVVTAKQEALARATLAHVGLTADAVVGWAWAEAKGEALREHGATVMVGDHLGDIAGARVARGAAVAVATGPVPAVELAAADVVLDDLTAFPAWLEQALADGGPVDLRLLERRLAALHHRLGELGSLVVAFSGGADSAFLLAAAVDVLGPDRVIAATAVSPSLPDTELGAARELAASLGVRHLTQATHEMDRAGYRANAGDRCFFCKAELLDVLAPLAARHGLAAVATGTNADDARAGFRPGIRAADERGAVTPLLDAGLTKVQVRRASRARGLPTWDKPAAACLASRIAYGVTVSPQRLARVQRAEVALRTALDAAGIAVRDLRVRDLGDRARVEVDRAAVAALTQRPDVLAAVAGFDAVEVDPRGFRSGAMNELLADPERWR